MRQTKYILLAIFVIHNVHSCMVIVLYTVFCFVFYCDGGLPVIFFLFCYEQNKSDKFFPVKMLHQQFYFLLYLVACKWVSLFLLCSIKDWYKNNWNDFFYVNLFWNILFWMKKLSFQLETKICKKKENKTNFALKNSCKAVCKDFIKWCVLFWEKYSRLLILFSKEK